jgi:hypothetical protein
MSTLIPKACLDEIQKMQRQFIWGDTEHKRRFHAVGWDRITTPKWMGGLGLRKLEVMNKACLLKLVWQFKENGNEYWCKVLRSKYGNEMVSSNSTTTHSSLWRTLNGLHSYVDNYCYWSLGNGKSIDAWNQAWIDTRLCVADSITIPDNCRGLKVNQLVDGDGKWNWNLLTNWIPEEIIRKIAAIPPPNDEYGNDERVGIGGNLCGFSVADMYNILCDYHGEANNSLWNYIWRLKVPERIHTLVWLMNHNRLLTNSLKSKMGLCQAMCGYCGDVEETILHIMRDCPKAKELWAGAVTIPDRGRFFSGDLNHWISVNMNNAIQWTGRGAWCDFWATSCHCLWTWRNKEIHDEDFIRPYRQFQHIVKLMGEYSNAVTASDVAAVRNKCMRLIRWKPPKPLFVLLNTDGAVKENRIAGCGGVIRGDQGEWLGGFAKCVGLCSAFVAELWGVVEGLRYAYHLGFRQIELNIDSVAVVQAIKSGKSKSMMGNSLLKQIKRLLDMN